MLVAERELTCLYPPSSFGLGLTSLVWSPLLSVPFLVSAVEGPPVLAVLALSHAVLLLLLLIFVFFSPLEPPFSSEPQFFAPWPFPVAQTFV